MRLYGTRPVCNACAEGFETYYGANALGVNKKRPADPIHIGDVVYFRWAKWNDKGYDRGTVIEIDRVKKQLRLELKGSGYIRNQTLGNIPFKAVYAKNRNTTGICTKMVDEILESLEIETEEEKNNPWYIRWVGTYEQAARRIEAFKRKQAEMYDNNDPNYDFVTYYTNLIILNLDYWVKRVFNICNVKVDESGDENRPLTDKEASYWASVLSEINEKWKSAAVGAAAGGVGVAGAAAVGALTIGTGGIAPATIAALAAGGAAAGAILGAGGKKLIGKIWTVIKAGGMLLYKLFTMILQMPFVQEVILDMVEEYRKKLCRSMAIQQNRISLRSTNKNGDTKQFNEITGQWMSLTRADKAEQARAIAKASSDKFWGNVNKFQAALTSLSGPDGDGILKRATDALSMNGPNSPLKKIFAWITTIPGVSQILNHLNITPNNLSVMITTALMKTGTKTWNSMMAANSGVGRIMRLYDSISGDGGCLDSNGNLVLTDGGDASQGAQYCAYAFEQAIHNVPYYAIMLLNAMHKDPQCRLTFDSNGQINDENWTILYNLYLESLIMGQILPCGHPSHKKLDDENWQSKKKLLLNFYEQQLQQYEETIGRREYGLEKDGSQESERSLEFQQKFNKDVADKFKPKPEPIQMQQLKDEAAKSWTYWQIAGLTLAAGVGVGLVIASGGLGVGAAAGLNAAIGSAGSAVSGAATVVGSASTATTGFIATNGATILKSGYSLSQKVANSYAGQAIAGAALRKIGDEILDIGAKAARIRRQRRL